MSEVYKVKVEKESNKQRDEPKRKRSYSLKESTIKKLQRLAIDHYPLGTNLEDIVDESICLLYDIKYKLKENTK